ncbi:hypothetical protein L873DRAFT_46275 [Choiromyces venosus 120613-1]|uniref:Uncharacterized protein n=1 Tax=Choiromyces venosus 120613-1 TaxID=1336337 RepID=A0A3N4K098_9PEZI|nr:hypothetical protein L873DRAFT_46275 [Choiromyces venosus 120613-1]
MAIAWSEKSSNCLYSIFVISGTRAGGFFFSCFCHNISYYRNMQHPAVGIQYRDWALNLYSMRRSLGKQQVMFGKERQEPLHRMTDFPP